MYNKHESSSARTLKLNGVLKQSQEACARTKVAMERHQPIYSVCITNYNSIDTIRESMKSIFHQLNDSFEIVICDNCSDDGSREILQEYARRGKIKLIVEKSSRGKGRQIAFENSKGRYIISGIDTDDRLRPGFHEFLSTYHREHEGYMFSAVSIHIIPRKLVEEIGGWRDLKWGEDIDFCARVRGIQPFERQYRFGRTALVERGRNKRSFTARLSERYNASQCSYRMGISVFDQVKASIWFYRPIVLAFAAIAPVVCKCKRVQKFEYHYDLPGRSDVTDFAGKEIVLWKGRWVRYKSVEIDGEHKWVEIESALSRPLG
jgi:glycosyltransferase involved in cell wall biosynthesis